MLKCPSCQKRVLGPDLVSGLCSHCGTKLAGSDDSSLLGLTAESDSIDPFTLPSQGANSAAATAQTMVADDSVDPTQATLSESDSTPVSSRPTVATEQTIVEDSFVSATSDSAVVSAESDAVSAFTFVSEDFGTDSHLDTAEVGAGASPDRTMVVDDPDDPGSMRTFVGDTDAPPSEPENSDRTMVLDTPKTP